MARDVEQLFELFGQIHRVVLQGAVAVVNFGSLLDAKRARAAMDLSKYVVRPPMGLVHLMQAVKEFKDPSLGTTRGRSDRSAAPKRTPMESKSLCTSFTAITPLPLPTCDTHKLFYRPTMLTNLSLFLNAM